MQFSLCKHIQCHDVGFDLKRGLGVIDRLGRPYAGTPYFGHHYLGPLASSVPQVTVPDIPCPYLRHNPSVSTDFSNVLHVFLTSSTS